MVVVTPSGCMPLRSITSSCSLQVGLLGAASIPEGKLFEGELHSFHLTIEAFCTHHQVLML